MLSIEDNREPGGDGVLFDEPMVKQTKIHRQLGLVTDQQQPRACRHMYRSSAWMLAKSIIEASSATTIG